MSSSATPQNTHSPRHPLLASSSSSGSIPANPPHEVNVRTATAEGIITATGPSHGEFVIPNTNTPAPPSISGSTATGTTATTRTSTTMVSASGASSTSSPPPLFPRLVTHAPPQLSVTNANAHPILGHDHNPTHIPPPPPPPSNQVHQTHTGPPQTPSTVPSTSSHPLQQQPHQQGISTPRQIEEARRAVVASISNLVDRELTGRASQLHSNNAAIEKQEREISKTLDTFRKDNDKLARLAADHTKKIKEIGNVQNWAEMLEREFLILEETIRLANRGGRGRGEREGEGEEGEDGDSGSWSGSGSGSYSGSWSGSEAGDGPERGETRADREGEGVNGTNVILTAPSGDQGARVPDGDGQDQGDASTVSEPKAPVLLGKGKEREGDIQLALAEAMETDLVIKVSSGAGYEPGPSSSR